VGVEGFTGAGSGERSRRAPEWYVTSERKISVGAMLLAILLLVAGIIWAWIALRLFSPPANVCEGCAEDWFRRTQLALAAGGIVSMAVAVAYLIHIARTGRTWRRRRAVTAVLAVFVLAWALLVLAVSRL
jgi:hypothetical protein